VAAATVKPGVLKHVAAVKVEPLEAALDVAVSDVQSCMSAKYAEGAFRSLS
jgi:hypothetical protein